MCVQSVQGKLLPLNPSGPLFPWLLQMGGDITYPWAMVKVPGREQGGGKAQGCSGLSKPRAGSWEERPPDRGLGQQKAPHSGLGQMAESLLWMPQHGEVWLCYGQLRPRPRMGKRMQEPPF